MEIGAGGVAAGLGRRRIPPDPRKLGQGQLLGAVAAPAEGLDRRQFDRQILLDEAQHARRAVTRRIVHHPAIGQAEEDGVGIVGGEESAAIGGDREASPVAGRHPHEHAVQVRAAILAALDPHGDPPAEIGELADLDRGAERARIQLEAKRLIFVIGHRLNPGDDREIGDQHEERVEIGHDEQPPIAEPDRAKAVELRGERELAEGEQHAEAEADGNGEPQIFGDEIGQHLPHDARPARPR